jgi:hypothetical protein
MESLRDERFPLPQELIGDMEGSAREAVCSYLNEGDLFEKYRGYSYCRFHCGISDEKMGFREYTDGEWVWPEGLIHYVRSHNVILPEEFIAAAISRRRKEKIDETIPVSFDCWVEWAGQRRSPEIRQQLTGRLAAAKIAAAKLIESKIKSVAKREGESDQPCIMKGCSRMALVGRKVCARHFLSDRLLEASTQKLYLVPPLHFDL